MKVQKTKPNLIYGIQPIKEALKGERTVDKVLIRQGLNKETDGELKQAAAEAGVPYQYVPGEKLHNLLPGVNHQGAVAYVAMVAYRDLEEFLESGEASLLLMLDGVSDVRNFGAIARSAECMGAEAIIIPEQGSARINAEAMKTSAGALNHIDIIRVKNLTDAAYMLKSYGIKIFSCTEKADREVAEVDLVQPVCIVMGSEGKGIQPKLLRVSDEGVRIPIFGEVNSLNVSVAAGMVLYEAACQRQAAALEE